LAWIGDEEIINRGKELQNKKMETNPNYNLLTNNIRINVFLTAVAIKIFKIDLIICEKNGAKKREYDKYGWEIIKPLIHSLKHNLFKSSYEIDYILYIPVLQEQINKYYTDVWRKKAQREFSEFYKEMTEVESLLELGMELFPVSSDSTKSKLEGEPDNASQSDIRYSVGYSAASSASSSSVNIGIFHSVNRLSPASPQNPAIPRQPSDENGKNLGAGLPL
jgi:hypothetical protein